ncbi:uncharacterized protein LOC6646518 [Drosophila willistoni]|uniref:uncharacterized protein LOC6646518 n=1 Tax=Drosophila willistoni TaxID=7260 RepID=UPI001F07281F|nr:uncharacterized protein LOC6646518 [Drosophila willistoni]
MASAPLRRFMPILMRTVVPMIGCALRQRGSSTKMKDEPRQGLIAARELAKLDNSKAKMSVGRRHLIAKLHAMRVNKFATATSSSSCADSFGQDEPEDEHNSWLSRGRKNQPQWNALGSASFVMISGGMSQAWGAGFAIHSGHRDQLLMTVHMQISWYAAATIGAILGALLTHRIPQQPIYIIGSCLVLACGVLFLAWPERSSVIIAARYLDGLANGLVFVPALSTVGEISVDSMRGLLSSSVDQLSCNTGIMMQLLYTSIWHIDWNVTIVADQVHGVLSIVYGVIALALAATLCVESPVYLLLRSNEQRAVAALRHLQRPYMVTSETFLQLDEHKRYVAANRELKLCEGCIQRGLPPLLKLLVQRCLSALGMTLVFWTALTETIARTSPHIRQCWPYMMLGILRWSGCLCVVPLMDTTGRKKPTLFGTFAAGAFAVAFATLFERMPHMISALAMLFSFQFFTGMANTASAVYMTEAFPLSIKPYFIALVYVMELLTRLIFCSYTPTLTGIATYFYAMGGLSMILFLLGIFSLPETRLTTLTEAQEKMRRWFNKDF